MDLWDDAWESEKELIMELPNLNSSAEEDSAYVVVQGSSWEEAEANANKLGGHLVTINNE